ncbi:MAG: hypothetical protein Q7T17_09495 [Microbacterium sp.]|uniref:glycosyltransferase n=1 Tax=Microbacterium sp. TaxID=51671 RepID=UPI0027257E94|nr:hypothetical protein [Microbacterium sp.]MDO8383197.1 hypothetical protein [Microbacterium sp.]
MLFALKPNPLDNPFGEWLVRSLPARTHARWFSWRTAILGRYDIFHVQWPEYLFDSNDTIKAVGKAVLGSALLLRLFIMNTPVVQTIHTQRPYEGVSKLASLQSRVLARRTVFKVYLNESSENDYSQGAVILLGRYQYSIERAQKRSTDSSILFFGLIKEYKGIEDLLSAFGGVDDRYAVLSIVGPPTDQGYASQIAALASRDQRVALDMRRLTDEELVATIDDSNLVVLPYRTMYNSSALLLALDRGVPVLAPASPANLKIQEEVGADWLRLFDQVLDASALQQASQFASRTIRDGADEPNLVRREWSTIGELHGELYEIVVASTRHDRRVSERRTRIRYLVERDSRFRSHSAMNSSGAQSTKVHE